MYKTSSSPVVRVQELSLNHQQSEADLQGQLEIGVSHVLLLLLILRVMLAPAPMHSPAAIQKAPHKPTLTHPGTRGDRIGHNTPQ